MRIVRSPSPFGKGNNPKAVWKVVALRKMDAPERQEEDAILETYKSALGLT